MIPLILDVLGSTFPNAILSPMPPTINSQMGAQSLSKNSKMSKSFFLFTAIATMANIMADPLIAPTCTQQGRASAAGVTCEGSKVVEILWPHSRLTGNIKALANLTHLTTLYLLSYDFK